jgi:hypothetical protein
MLEWADLLEQPLEQHPPNQFGETLHLTDDIVLRSFTWALAAGDSVAGGLSANRR